MISAVAELYHLHPQTLRLYERVGLLKPSRSQGNTRLYTDSDLERLEVPERQAGRLPLVETKRRRRRARNHALQQDLVHGHVPRALGRWVKQKAPALRH